MNYSCLISITISTSTLVLLLLPNIGNVESNYQQEDRKKYMTANLDGFFNNPTHHDWGSTGANIEHYYGSPNYLDGAFKVAPGPNARKISDAIFRGDGGTESTLYNTLFAYFGQLISREIVDYDEPGCPRELIGIDVSEDSVFNSTLDAAHMIKMPVYRAKYNKKTGKHIGNPRKQMNGVTSWIDGSFIYGPMCVWTDALRSFKKGHLTLDSRDLPSLNSKGLPIDNFPPPSTHKLTEPSQFWALGDRRAHENPALLSLSVLFMRYHNKIADQLADNDETLSDKDLFALARKEVVAVLQSIIYYEWLPLLLGEDYNSRHSVYSGYQPSIAPFVDSHYAAVSSKWFMTLQPSMIPVMSKFGCAPADSQIRLCESWFEGQRLISESESDLVKDILLGMVAQPAEKEDQYVVEDVLDYSYGPLHFSRIDAVAEHIMRGRDFGIKTKNLKSKSASHFLQWNDLTTDFNIESETVDLLKELYGNKDEDLWKLDLFVLHLLEKGDNSTGPGSFIKEVIGTQLNRVRNADYFWFENEQNGLFESDDIQRIRDTKFHDVLETVFGQQPFANDAFAARAGGPGQCRFEPQRSEHLTSCSPVKTFDYFAGNEAAFIISWIWIALFPVGVIGLAYGIYTMSERRKKRGASAPTTQMTAALLHECSTDPSREGTTIADEWVDQDELHTVRIKFDKDKYVIYVTTLDDIPKRSINMSAYEVLKLNVSNAYPYMAHMELPKSYDLVLKFFDREHLVWFSSRLNSYMYANGKLLVRQAVKESWIRKKAVTKAKRRENLNHFFRNVFAQSFNKEVMSDASSFDVSTNRDVVEFEISKEEFADSLGMNPKSKFVELMFNVADKQKRGFLRYREILELVIIMSQGSPDRKLELLFDMFDFDNSGYIARTEVRLVVRSLVDLAGTYMETSDLEDIVTEMYDYAGLSHKDELDFADFKKLLTSKYENFIDKVGVDWKGIKHSKPDKKSRTKKLFNSKSDEVLRLDSLDDDTLSSFLHSKKSVKRAKRSRRGSTATMSSGDEDSQSADEAASTISMGSYTPYRNNKKLVSRLTSLNLSKPPMPRLDAQNTVLRSIFRYFENTKRELAVLFFFYAVCVGLFIERFFYYAFMNEHNGVRQTLSLGVAFARGAAEVCSFTFSILLITMSYNMVRYLRETFVNLYIPFDKNIVFHKIVAWTGLAFAAVHVVAYGFNYYFLASGPASHACFFDTLFYKSNGFIRVASTLYGTLAGATGVLMVLVLFLMYIFASQTSRRYMHNTFWMFHKLYMALYILLLVHGLGALTQSPNFYAHFLGPAILFTIDKLMSISRKKMKLDIVKVDFLPSSVTELRFKRPANFEYKAGMWVRIACDALSSVEYHPFTLTSAPHEDCLSLHIRGVGPWTKNIRSKLQSAIKEGKPMPSVYVDGPFGSGQQDWYNFEVSVLVGAGIGVTPYASILKSFVHMMRTKNRFKIKCQKVYFIWSTSNQKSFEWFIEILKQVEEVDINCTVSTNIFITQFFQSFDLRTSMLYVFEEHAKRVGGTSLFTGLKATTNFGRPNFNEIFQKISEEHLRVKNVGVFSCGPPGLTKGVEQACIKASGTTHSQFQHHYENF